MAIGDIIVGIDIGSSKVSLVVGEVNNFNQIELVYTVEHKCKGIKKTKIIDEDEIANAIIKSIQDAEKEAEIKINSAYLTISGKYVTIVQNSITKNIKDKFSGVSAKDVSSALLQVRDIDVPEGQNIIDIVTDKFILDDGRIVEDPVGNLVSEFTINAQVILGDKDYIKQLSNICKKADIDIIKGLGRMLGKTDLSGQISEIKLVNNFIDAQIEDAKQEKDKNYKMYKTLGIVVGATIVIILA